MRAKIAIIIYFFLLFYTNFETGYAFPQRGDYLWIEFEKQIKEKNGSMTQPLFIHYGRFPYKKGDVLDVEELQGFYTLNEKDENREKIFYPADIERTDKAGLIKINSLKTNCFTVLIAGKKNFGEGRYLYLAKASFVLFGHSATKTKEAKMFVQSGEIAKQMEICIAPEYYYWPQTGDSIKLAPFFDKAPLRGKEIYITDEDGNYIAVETDKFGNYVYIPPDDRRLRLKGERAFKQSIILAEKTVENTIHKSSYTLLFHRSRFGNRNLRLGSSIFSATSAIVFIAVVIRRKNFKI